MRRTLVIARRHIANLCELWPEGEVACVSASGRRIEVGETKATRVLQNLEEALDWQPEFAVVASPAPFHLMHAAKLAEHGVAVLIEKPVAILWKALKHGLRLLRSMRLEWMSPTISVSCPRRSSSSGCLRKALSAE